ncbi:MAG TPA: helix-turn-helix transcriptional regulator [Pseudonocardiaceae bacterium]|nr:helix-turn-helix transcriptional regulator [Pseudonocardiaceae bacterium]
MTRPPGSYRRHLGRELRHAREEAGLTQKDVAVVLKCEQAKVAKLEVELMEIRLEELEKLMRIYELAPAKRDQLREARANSDIPRATANLPKHSKAYVKLADLEGEASEILGWHSERIPGPLQSEPYMLKQFNLNKPGDNSYVTQLVRERTARNNLFTTDPAPCYRVILSVSSLQRIPGGLDPKLALEQMDHLIRLMKKYPQLDLRLLTLEANIPAAVSDFTVLKFRESTPSYIQASDFAYIEHPGGGQIINDTRPFLEKWDELLNAASSRTETLELLTEWSREVYDQLVKRATG